MSIGAAGNCNLYIDGIAVEQVHVMKYLGVMIDSKLKFKENVNYVSKKIAKKVGLLGRLKRKLDLNTKCLLYKALIAPHLDYCSSMLFLNNDTEIRGLQKLQNRALRIILNENRLSHIADMLNRLDLLDVKQRIYFNVIVLFFKIEKGMLPNYLRKNLTTVGDAQPYHLRSNSQYRLPRYRTEKGQNSLFYKGLKLFNEVKNVIGVTENFNEFKKSVKIYVLENVSSH